MITEKYLRITMPDNSQYDVPVTIIAKDRAEHYADEFGGDLVRSLLEDTIPLFEENSYEVQDWAAGNMDWSDVENYATEVTTSRPVDFQKGWLGGEKEVVCKPQE